MPIGPVIRRLFGRHEHRVAALFRAFFFDINDYKRRLQTWASAPQRILEVGCGEGAVTEALAEIYPGAEIMAIDITPSVGRLYRGSTQRVRFQQVTVEEVARDRPGEFDLVVFSDVIHHVPEALRREVLDAARRSLGPGGLLVLKDWEPRRTPIHWLCHACDRWLTGDRVSHLTSGEMSALLSSVSFRPLSQDVRLRPWANNFALLAHA
ncbi:trans-aconitate 2-methyltransferase [Novosphingobium sp. 9U]|uniref:class I SAM-dependent methyltransferase n=1 Tax=Novosphingobium sp. 9U TaxID=2653158 RepID=UPI0012F19A88|nr:class I SAM-dependent methyltransferase [Novosphingobium sp. 9U]VWX48757.1 3-demethylubiquinone-9 3-methyltransferase [Novosphingobium sp. 9U]